jgi:hypothetical protein
MEKSAEPSISRELVLNASVDWFRDCNRGFNNNFEIPIIQITELDFHFSNGLEIHTAFTDKRAVNNFATALTELGVSR